METAVVMFCFRRPRETRKVLEALAVARPSRVYVFFDGPRPNKPDDIREIHETRALFNDLGWPCNLKLEASEVNLGLSRRITSALDAVFEIEDFAVILEDDCVPSESFFDYVAAVSGVAMQDERIALISGNNFGPRLGSGSYRLSRSAYIWGWATSKQAWHEFRSSNLGSLDANQLEQEPALRKTFNSLYLWILFRRTLKARQRVDSWALYFSSWVRLNGKYSVLPQVNLVKNIGFSNTATHTAFALPDTAIDATSLESPICHPASLQYKESWERIEGWYRAWALIRASLRSPRLAFSIVTKLLNSAKS